jgi:hypothetical protein
VRWCACKQCVRAGGACAGVRVSSVSVQAVQRAAQQSATNAAAEALKRGGRRRVVCLAGKAVHRAPHRSAPLRTATRCASTDTALPQCFPCNGASPVASNRCGASPLPLTQCFPLNRCGVASGAEERATGGRARAARCT